MCRAAKTLAVLLALINPVIVFAQQRVDPHFTYYRVYCVVPVVGTGGPGDPIRPDDVPMPGRAGEKVAASSGNILSVYHELSDDKKWALAEVVATNWEALAPILNDSRPGVWAVKKGSVPLSEVYAMLRRYKKSINFNTFGAVVR